MCKKMVVLIVAFLAMCFSVNSAYAYYCENSKEHNEADHYIRSYVDTPENPGDLLLFKVVEKNETNCSLGIAMYTLPFNSDKKYETGAQGNDRILVCVFKKDGKIYKVCDKGVNSDSQKREKTMLVKPGG